MVKVGEYYEKIGSEAVDDCNKYYVIHRGGYRTELEVNEIRVCSCIRIEGDCVHQLTKIWRTVMLLLSPSLIYV